MNAVADTSFVVALITRTETYHEVCFAASKTVRVIYLPQTTLAEVGYLLSKRYGNLVMARFLAQLPQSKFRLVPLDDTDIARTAELLQKYADSRVDFVDATIAAVAERLNIIRILTLDRRDFALIRPKHVAQFEILPEKA
ncbi:MAG: PIN domain-containing protein [Anaerolinea sp.]|nr:PIN domain-containing protein [Anaerolinea sp.]